MVAGLQVVDSILDTVGGTPLIELRRLAGGDYQLFGKLESRNPAGSVKDRIGVEMIRDAQERGELRRGMTIVEPTSGNTGIALAMAAAALGYRLVLTMPESMSLERRQVMASYGARIVLTPTGEDMAGAIRKAEELKAEDPGGVFMPQQFGNPANPAAHRRTTAREILEQVDLAGAGADGERACVRRAARVSSSGAESVLGRGVCELRAVRREPRRASLARDARSRAPSRLSP